MRKINLLVLASIILALGGCASNPPLSELRKKDQTVTFIQHGTKPTKMGFGIVDTKSFWAASGGGIGSQTGGWLWPIIGSIAQDSLDKRAPTDAELIKYLYNDHQIANHALGAIMPEFSKIFGIVYDPKKLSIVESPQFLEDKDGYLTGFTPTTDIVLVATLFNLILTEKMSFGGALAAGFTLGTNTKNVTGEAYVFLRAHKRESGTGRYKRVWDTMCAARNLDMKTAYPFPDVIIAREKAKEIWDETEAKLIENCTKSLAPLAS